MSGKTAEPAGVFAAQGDTTAVELQRDVPAGTLVGLTVERAGGAQQPSGKPFVLTAEKA